MDKEIVREFFQENCTVDAVADELKKILDDPEYREDMLRNYRIMLAKLGPPGCAERAAGEMVELLLKLYPENKGVDRRKDADCKSASAERR